MLRSASCRKKFDNWEPKAFRLTPDEIEQVIAKLAKRDLEDIKFAQAQVRRTPVRDCACLKVFWRTPSRQTCAGAATAAVLRLTRNRAIAYQYVMTCLGKSPSFRLDGRRALVTGGGRGIGLAAASALAQAGAHVTLAARTVAEIEAAAGNR
jgi:NADPH:quinone reductase-like Zn-dependent oxidoreductase